MHHQRRLGYETEGRLFALSELLWSGLSRLNQVDLYWEEVLSCLKSKSALAITYQLLSKCKSDLQQRNIINSLLNNVYVFV